MIRELCIYYDTCIIYLIISGFINRLPLMLAYERIADY